MPKKPSPKPLTLMNVDKGEEIAGAWVTPTVPGVGFYKLLAKKKKDGACEWVHFVQRADGTKESVYRGTVENQKRLNDVVEAINSALNTAYGPTIRLHVADYDLYTLDGKKASGTVH